MLVSELNWIAHNGPEHYGSGHYDFSLWLFPNILATRTLFIYVLTSWLFDIAIVLTVALSVPALIVLRRAVDGRYRSVQRVLLASVVTVFFAFFMLSRPSFYVWDNITLLQKIQFPWRWLSVLSLLSVLLFSLSLPLLMSKFQRFSRLVAYPALALVVTIVMFDITQIIIPSAPFPKAKIAQIVETLDTDPIWKGWWPTWAKDKAFANNERVMAGGREVEITDWDGESKEFIVQSGEPVSIGVKNFYYPLWKATVNGHPAEVGMDDNGAITIPVSNEVSRVHLYFEESLINNVARVVSSVTWLLPLGLITIEAGKWLEVRVPPAPLIQEHTAQGEDIVPWLVTLLVLGVVIATWAVVELIAKRRAAGEGRNGLGRGIRVGVSIVLTVAAIAVAAGSTWNLVRIGEAGSRAVWEGSFSDEPLDR